MNARFKHAARALYTAAMKLAHEWNQLGMHPPDSVIDSEKYEAVFSGVDFDEWCAELGDFVTHIERLPSADEDEGQDEMPAFKGPTYDDWLAAGRAAEVVGRPRLYRCKVRKPAGDVVDGCGYEKLNTPPGGSYGQPCPACGGGFLRPKYDDFTPFSTTTRRDGNGHLPDGAISTMLERLRDGQESAGDTLARVLKDALSIKTLDDANGGTTGWKMLNGAAGEPAGSQRCILEAWGPPRWRKEAKVFVGSGPEHARAVAALALNTGKVAP